MVKELLGEGQSQEKIMVKKEAISWRQAANSVTCIVDPAAHSGLIEAWQHYLPWLLRDSYKSHGHAQSFSIYIKNRSKLIAGAGFQALQFQSVIISFRVERILSTNIGCFLFLKTLRELYLRSQFECPIEESYILRPFIQKNLRLGYTY